MTNLIEQVMAFLERRSNWQSLSLLPLLVLLPVSFLILRFRFDGLYGQDAFAYFDYGTRSLRQALLTGDTLPSFFFPPGYPLLVFAASLLLGPHPIAGQLLSLLAGALAPLFTALMAREALAATDEYATSVTWIPFLAGLLLAATGQLWQSSAVVMSDTTALAAATAGAWALLRYGNGAPGRWLWLAASALAYALLTRWAYAPVALVSALYALYALSHRPRRSALFQTTIATLLVLAVLSPTLLSIWQNVQSASAGSPRFAGNFGSYNWGLSNAVGRELFTADGIQRFPLPNGLYYALLPAHRYYFTPLIAVLLLPGVVAFWHKRHHPALLMLAAWALLTYALYAGGPIQNFRYTLSYLPPLALFIALGVAWLARRLPPLLRPLLVLLLVVGVISMLAGGWTLTENFIQRKQADLNTVHWVQEQVESEARLFTFNITFTFQHYSHLQTYELYFLKTNEMSALLADDEPVYLLLDVNNVQSQWQGREPALNYAWLQDTYGLATLGQHRHYTLYQVQEGTP